MAYDGAGSLFALGVRLTKLDATGAPLAGPQSSYKSDALIQIQLGLEYEDGEEITQRNGSGNLCMYYRAPDTLKQGTIESFQVCTPDPNIKQFVIGGDLISQAGTAEVQTVTITGGPTGGTFTLTYNGQTTAGIAYDANATAVQSALEALPNVNPGDLVVTGAGPYTVTFSVSLGDVAQMTADGSNLTGGTDPDVTVATTTQGATGRQRPEPERHQRRVLDAGDHRRLERGEPAVPALGCPAREAAAGQHVGGVRREPHAAGVQRVF
jgi:hypothetical protein